MFGRMRLYAAYVAPASLERDRAVAMVKQGMSWPAFFFSVLWALWHRLWGTAVLLALALVGFDLLFLVLGVDDTASAIAWLGLAVYTGLSASDWRCRGLERRDMRLTAIVAAPNAERAVQRLLKRDQGGLV